MPVSTTWKPNLTAQRAGLLSMATRHVSRDTLALLNRARVLCPVRTGNLRNSHQMQVRYDAALQAVIGQVFTRVHYARPVHDGRRSRVIRVRRAKFLRFYWRGRWWYKREVHQPALRGRPWLHTALREIAATRGYRLTRSARYGGG